MGVHRVRPTLLVLHGHGDGRAASRRLADGLALEGWPVRTPEAPRGADGRRSWFGSGPRGVDPPTVEGSRRRLAAVIRACPPGPVVAVGFSQGAAMALVLDDDRLAAVVGICGYLPEWEGMELGAGPPALLLVGEADEVVPAFLGQDAAAAMSAAGREAVAETIPGGHEVSAQAVSRARVFLLDRWP